LTKTPYCTKFGYTDMTRTPRNAVVTGITAAFFGGIPLVYSPALFDPTLIVRCIAAYLLVMVAFLAIAFRSNVKVISIGFFEGVTLLFTLALTAGLFVANDISIVILDIFRSLLFLLLVLYFRTIITSIPSILRPISLAVSVNCIFQFLLVLLQHYGHYSLFGSAGGFFGTMTHSNVLAESMLFSLPLTVYGGTTIKNNFKRVAWVGMWCCTTLIVILTCRAVWLGLFAATTVVILAGYRSRFRASGVLLPVISRKRLRLLAVAGCLPVLVLIVLNLREISEHLSTFVQFDSSGRNYLWSHTLGVIKEHGAIGVGSGNWRFTLPGVSDGSLSNVKLIFYQRPHNEYLGILSENGIVALLLFLTMIGIVLLKLRANLRNPANKTFGLNVVALFGIISFLIVSFFAFPRERILNTVFIALYCAIPLCTGGVVKEVKANSRLMAVIVLLLSLCATLFLVNRYQSEAKVKRIITSQSMAPIEQINILKTIDPHFYTADPFSAPVPFYIGMAWLEMGNVDSMLYYMKKAYKVYSYHPEILLKLGTGYEHIGCYDSARVYLKKAISADSVGIRQKINLAIIELRDNNMQTCAEIVKSRNSVRTWW